MKVPQGYTTKHDDTGDYYECDFCTFTGEGEHEETHYEHPTPKNTGCVDECIIYIKEA